MAGHHLAVRVSSYSRINTAWTTVFEFPRRAVADVKCSFVSPHIEDRASLILQDVGTYQVSQTSPAVVAAAHDLFAAYRSVHKPLLRIDIFSSETSEPVDTRSTDATGWIDGVLFWSGYIDEVTGARSDAERALQITAVGWTGYLDRLTIRDQYFTNATMRSIVDSLFSDSSLGLGTQWPGDIVQVKTGTNGSDNSLVIEEIGWKAATFRQILDQLAALGNFQYGISVSGFPFSTGANTEEFVFVQMAEPFYDLDEANSDGIDHSIDVDHPSVKSYRIHESDGRYTTRWEFVGEPIYADVISVISGHDRDEVRDTFSIASGESGVFQWEPGGVRGWNLAIVDRALRRHYRDSASGQVYAAGRVVTVPGYITRKDSDATFRIDTYTESGGESIYSIYRFPAPEEDLTLDITDEALRYRLEPAGQRVVRIIMDEEADDPTVSTGRERSSRIVDDPGVRGYLQAGLFALQERTQERFASVRVELAVSGWTRFFSGSDRTASARIGVRAGTGRLTRFGTASNGGDDYAKGDDTREVGLSLLLEIRRAEAVWTEDGWEMTYELGGVPRDFVTSVLPSFVRTRNRRRV